MRPECERAIKAGGAAGRELDFTLALVCARGRALAAIYLVSMLPAEVLFDSQVLHS